MSEPITMPRIDVYRTWTQWQHEADDEPETVKESEDSYPCYPDKIDQSEGLTAVDLAVAVLEGKLYVTETSNYPWRPGSWYSAEPGADFTYGMDGADEHVTAHLIGFSPEEEREIYETVSKHVPSMR